MEVQVLSVAQQRKEKVIMKKCRFCGAELQKNTEYKIPTSVYIYKCPVCKAEWQTHIIQTAAPKKIKFPEYTVPVPEIGKLICVNRETVKMSRVTDVFPGLSSGNIFRDNTTHFVKVEDLPCHFFNWVYLSKEQKYFRRGH